MAAIKEKKLKEKKKAVTFESSTPLPPIPVPNGELLNKIKNASLFVEKTTKAKEDLIQYGLPENW